MSLNLSTPTSGRGRSAAEAIDALNAGILVLAESGRIEVATLGAARILGRETSDLEAMSIEEIFGPIERLLPKAMEARTELLVSLPDQRSIEIGLTVTEYEGRDDGQRRIVLLFQELALIRELRKEQDRLLQLAAVGEVLPSVLHELRNPLAAITTLLEVFLDEGDDVKAADHRAILSEVRRMALTLQGLGGLVRSAHAERTFAIDVAVRDACRVLEPMAERKGLELRAIGADLPLLDLEGDVISGVVFNLVKNAIDACGAGSRIEVDARIDQENSFVLIVSDDGPGMSQETISRCREMFYTTNSTGSGIGLALCERITEISGGSLQIESELGKGTTVTLTIPQRQKSQPQAALAKHPHL